MRDKYTLGDRISFSILDYGASTLETAANNTTYIQAAEDAAAARAVTEGSPVSLYFPLGVYEIDGYITKKANVIWTGQGRLKSADAGANHHPLVYANGVDDWSIDGLSFRNQDPDDKAFPTSAIIYQNSCVSVTGCSRWSIKDCKMNKFSIGVFYDNSNDFKILDNNIIADIGKTIASLDAGTITFPTNLSGTAGITSDQLQGVVTPSSYNGIISNNFVSVAGLDQGISISQTWGETPIIVSNNVVEGPKAGIQAYTGTLTDPGDRSTFQRRMLITGNKISDTWETGIYVRGTLGVMVTNNSLVRTALNGVTAESGTPYGGIITRVALNTLTYTSVITTDVGHVIRGNDVIDTGNVTNGSMSGISIRTESTTVSDNRIIQSEERYGTGADKLIYGVFVSDNVTGFKVKDNLVRNVTDGVQVSRTSFIDDDKANIIQGNVIENTDTAIQVGDGFLTSCLIDGNTIINAASTVFFIRKTIYTTITNNLIKDCAGVIYQLQSSCHYSFFLHSTDNRVGPTTTVKGNTIYGTYTTLNAIGETSGTDNRWSGRVLDWDDTANGEKFSIYRANSVPTTSYQRTWYRGDIVFDDTPTASSSIGTACVQSGTYGTIVATTADTTASSATITVSTELGLVPNVYITIAGVTGVKKVVSVTGTTVVVDTVCDATVSTAAVAYSAPVFKAMANLAA